LRTKDEREALRRLPVVAGRLLAERERLARTPDGQPRRQPKGPPKEAAKWAEWWRDAVFARGGNPDRGDVPLDLEVALEREIERRLGPALGEQIEEDGRTGPRYAPDAEEDATELAALAQGRRRPISSDLERFLAEQRVKPRTASRTKLATKRLSTWRRGRPGGDDLRVVDRREAGLFVDNLLADGLTTATANSMVTALSSYWKWMEKRGLVRGNPWREQSRQETELEAQREVRPFTDDEVVELLNGTTTRTLHDLMRLGALTGARINELANLQVADAEGDLFRIRVSKTAAGVRRVPIHPALKPLVARRVAGKSPDAYLFDELRAPASRPAERSAKASERFTEYRRECGIDDRQEGQRNSNVNFHSWRHRFITQALAAGHPLHLVSAVVGHQAGRESVTLRTYNATGPATDQLRAVVESVSLPQGALVESPEGHLMNSGVRRRS
jgi:integrase